MPMGGKSSFPALSLAVVGADFPNKKGPTRRFEIAMCRPGERVELRPEPHNTADPYAIAVYSKRGVQIGYLTAERAPRLTRIMESHEARAIFQMATSYGAVIRAAFDGEDPILPEPRPPVEEPDFEAPWVDETYPDD